MQSISGSQLPVPVNQNAAPMPQYVHLEPMGAVPGEGDASALVEYWHLVLFRKWTVAIFILMGILGSALFTFLKTPVYQAKTTIEIEAIPENPGGIRLGGEGGGPALPPESYVNTQAKILTSKTLKQKVDKRVSEKPRENGRPVSKAAAWAKALGIPMASGAASGSGAGVAPAECLVRVVENTRMIEVACDSADPAIASDYANTLVQEYIDSSVASRWQAAQRSTSWLTNQLADLKKQLQGAEMELRNYRSGAGLLTAGETKQDVRMERLLRLQEELARAQGERATKQSTYEVAKLAPPDSLPEIMDNGRLSGYQTKLADLRREYAELTAQYTPEHYRVKRVQAQVEEMESTLKKERTAIMSRVESDYRAAQRREALLNAEFASQAAVVSDKSSKAMYADILAQEVNSLRGLYDELLRKLKEAAVASTLTANMVHVVDAAEPPPVPYKPNPMRNLIVGLGSGLLLGVAFVLSGDWVNRRLKAPGETPFHLHVPELGVIPEHRSDGQFGTSGKLALRGADGIEDKDASDRRNVALVTWHDRPSPTAESFRGALASILIGGRNRVRPQVILMTSPARGDGKSTTVSNVGISLAEINQRVVLVDADIRKPQMHNIFGLPNNWGLSDLLRDKTALDKAPIQALVRETRIENLYVLPAGPGTASISNLLYSNRLPQLIERFRNEFDTVIIDTPPMLYVADARVLGRIADAAILVLRAGKTTRDEALRAKQRLVEDGIDVMGTILNAYDPKTRARYGYSGYYGNYYSDGESS